MEPPKNEPALINVHKVFADKQIINHFRLGDPEVIEGYFYEAKRRGRAAFMYDNRTHHLIRQDDGSYRVEQASDRAMTEEWA